MRRNLLALVAGIVMASPVVLAQKAPAGGDSVQYKQKTVYDFDDDLIVKHRGQLEARGINSPDDFGNGRCSMLRVSWIFSFRAVGQEKISSCPEPGRFKKGKHHLACRPRIGRALKYDELARPQPGCNHAC